MDLKKTYKQISRRVTIIFMPHHNLKPIKFNFTFAFLFSLIFFWVALTGWATYLTVQQIDYWTVKANNLVLKAKTIYFAQEVKRANEMLERVKEADDQLRSLLNMKSRKAIIEGQNAGTGGPTPEDSKDLQYLLEGKVADMSQEDIRRQVVNLTTSIEEQIKSYQEIQGYIKESRSIYRATPNIWPTYGSISSHYGSRRHPWGYDNFHPGIDIANRKGTPIRAAADGIIRLASYEGGYGRLVLIEHGYGYTTLYGHMSAFNIKVGQRVKRGQIIGYVGASGRATGPHLHYEVRIGNVPRDPLKFMRGG